MARIGENIQAGLGRVDYSPLAQGIISGGQLRAQGIASLGNAISQTIKENVTSYYKSKEEEKADKAIGSAELANLNNNIKQAKQSANKNLYSGAPEVSDEQLADLNKRINSTNAIDRKAAIAEISALNQSYKEAPTRAIQRMQFDNATVEAEQRRLDLAQREQDRRNLDAMSKAISGLPSTVSDTQMVQRPVVTQREAMMNQSPELFPFSGNQPMAQAPQAAAPVGNVPNKIPENLDPFLFPDTLKGQYALRTDLINQASQKLTLDEQEAKRRADELEKTLRVGKTAIRGEFVQDAAIGSFNAPIPVAQRVPLSSTEYETTLNQYNAAKSQYQDVVKKKTKFNELQAQANKLAGAPLEVPAGKLPTGNEPIDEISGAIANATGRSVGNVKSIIESEYKTELRNYEEKVDRPLTGKEKAQKILLAYEKGGGQITPKIKADIEKMTQDEVRVIKSGNLTFVSVGGQPFEMVKSKDPSVAQQKYDDTQEFALLVDAISQGDSLESFDPEIVARARRAYITRPQTNALTGTMMNFEEYINSLRPANKRQQNPGIVTPITPSAANQTSGRTSSGLEYSATLQSPKG